MIQLIQRNLLNAKPDLILLMLGDLKRLEPCTGKFAHTVLRRVVTGNSHGLSDNSATTYKNFIESCRV